MNSDDVILVGVKNRVLALSRQDGRILWSTKLQGGMGSAFVTVLWDGGQVFAHAGGHLHCLDIVSGRVLWINELSGCGYGIASLAIPGSLSAPGAAGAEAILAAQQASAGGATAGGTP